jgi:hypothetical protein
VISFLLRLPSRLFLGGGTAGSRSSGASRQGCLEAAVPPPYQETGRRSKLPQLLELFQGAINSAEIVQISDVMVIRRSLIGAVDQLSNDSHPPQPYAALERTQLAVRKLAVSARLQPLQHLLGLHVWLLFQPAQQDRPDLWGIIIEVWKSDD